MAVRALREVFGCAHPAFLDADELLDAYQGIPPVASVPPPRGARRGRRWRRRPGPRRRPASSPTSRRTFPTNHEHLQELIDKALGAMFERPLTHDRDGDVRIVTGKSVIFVQVVDDRPAVDLYAEVVSDVARPRAGGRGGRHPQRRPHLDEVLRARRPGRDAVPHLRLAVLPDPAAGRRSPTYAATSTTSPPPWRPGCAGGGSWRKRRSSSPSAGARPVTSAAAVRRAPGPRRRAPVDGRAARAARRRTCGARRRRDHVRRRRRAAHRPDRPGARAVAQSPASTTRTRSPRCCARRCVSWSRRRRRMTPSAGPGRRRAGPAGSSRCCPSPRAAPTPGCGATTTWGRRPERRAPVNRYFSQGGSSPIFL